MRKRIILLLFIPTILLYSALFSQERYAAEYRIGPRDLLDIRVFGLDELNQTVRVSEDGKISLPLLGEIEVENLTKSELEQKLVELLKKDYLQDPRVSVFIQEYRSKRISLLGGVRNPGPYELLGRETLLQILSQAGGLTNDAGNEIIILREFNNGAKKSLKISIDDLIFQGDERLNIPLWPNDIINIPIDKIVKIYVFGQVNNPGALQVKQSNIPTLLRAIAQAGGFSNRASKKNVVIKRKDIEGEETQIKVNVKEILKGKPDFQLMENDVVFVPESIF